MAGAVFGDVELALFVAGAVFGDVELALFVAGAVFDGNFQYKMLVVGVKSNLGCEAGCGLTVSWSDHARIMVGSCSDHARIMVGSWSDRPRIGNDVSSVFSKFL